jgi:hypothetical protein
MCWCNRREKKLKDWAIDCLEKKIRGVLCTGRDPLAGGCWSSISGNPKDQIVRKENRIYVLKIHIIGTSSVLRQKSEVASSLSL